MSQIMFFDKSVVDYANTSVVTTVTDAVAINTGESFIDYIYNRDNNSGWMTTGSTDAANTTVEIDFGQTFEIDNIILILHNLKSYTIKYDDTGWTDFSTAISETTNAEETIRHSFTAVSTSKIQIVISGAMVVDADKYMRQIIITSLFGQLNGYPMIKGPTHSTNKIKSTMLSGKKRFMESVGGFSTSLTVESLEDSDDLQLIEDLYTQRLAKLVWLCGGSESQFRNALKGYRLKDFYLVRPSSEYRNELYKNYRTGTKINLKLDEVVE